MQETNYVLYSDHFFSETELISVYISFTTVQFSFQIFNAARQLSHIEAAPDKSGLVLLDYWVGLKRCLVIIHN